jgi:hypothetical protein
MGLLSLLGLKMPEGKCKYSNRCEYFSEECLPCTKTAGSYYGPGRHPVCYRDIEKREKKKENRR